MGYLHRLQELARQRPGHDAVCDALRTWSYAELLHRVQAACARLREQGIGPQAVVGLALDDEAEHLVATLALLAAGARQVVLATHDPEPVRRQLAERVGVTHLLGPAGVTPQAAAGSCAAAAPARAGTLVLKTSGTTGQTNLIVFDEEQIALQAGRHADYRDERLLRMASIEHNNSKRHRLYCVWAGGTNVFRPVNSEVIDFAIARGVTCLDIARLHAADLAAAPGAHRLAGIKLRTGGSAVPFGLRRAIEQQVTTQLCVRYAASECGAVSMALPGEHDEDEPSGRPLPGVELQVVGADGSVLPPGEAGEIRLRAPGMASGYLDNPAQSAARFRDGWFYPGDVGRLRADGQLLVQGRRDDMIVLNGLNIFPAEIETVLERHTAVAEAAALPLSSAVHGQIPVAAVVLHAGAVVAAEELRRWCHGQLGLRAPRRVLVLDRLPKNSQGKVVKKELIDVFQPKPSGT